MSSENCWRVHAILLRHPVNAEAQDQMVCESARVKAYRRRRNAPIADTRATAALYGAEPEVPFCSSCPQ